MFGAEKRSGFGAGRLTLAALGRAKARRESLRDSLYLQSVQVQRSAEPTNKKGPFRGLFYLFGAEKRT